VRQREQSRIDASFAQAACFAGSAANEAARRAVPPDERTEMVRRRTRLCSFFVRHLQERQKNHRATLRPFNDRCFQCCRQKLS
jgi:hypothetical protein